MLVLRAIGVHSLEASSYINGNVLYMTTVLKFRFYLLLIKEAQYSALFR